MVDFSAFDFVVTEEVKALAAEVEKPFGRGIPIVETRETKYRGETRLENGQLQIRMGNRFKLYDLAHELWHIKRWIAGIPLISPEGGSNNEKFWTEHYDQHIEHVAIYPKLVEMNLGHDPYSDFGSCCSIAWFFAKLNQSSMRDEERSLRVSSIVWRTLLLQKDRSVSEAVRSHAVRRDRKAFDIGQRIADKIMQCGVESACQKGCVIQALWDILSVTDIHRPKIVCLSPSRKGNWYECLAFGQTSKHNLRGNLDLEGHP
ncbi:MAG: hypothetical protein AB1696_17740 [Planctomycetota bacterium]